MANYKEIVTKAVISKGKKNFIETNSVTVENPSTILGCWVINHNFNGSKNKNDIIIDGSYDINIWYSYDDDTKTDVIRETNTYREVVHMRDHEDYNSDEIIVRSLKQPNCIKAEINNNSITYVIEKELGIELVGDIKVKIEANEEEEPWDDIIDDDNSNDTIEDKIDKEISDDYINEKSVI